MSADCPECEHPDNAPARHYNVSGRRTYYECAACGCDWSIYIRSAHFVSDTDVRRGEGGEDQGR